MKHHILAKFNPDITPEKKKELTPEIFKLFSNTTSIPGIHSVEIRENCIARDNRYDIMLIIDMEKDALPEYDSCIWHKQWKEDYGSILEKKAIFDCE